MARPIESYRIYFHTTPNYKWDAFVDLYSGSKWIGRLKFMKEGQPIPENKEMGSAYVLHYPVKHFDSIVTILREEKPVYINLNTANGIGTIATSAEPVGEEEAM